jgi:regulatory protein
VAPRITALVAEPRDRVRVELDGELWRTLPAGAIVRSGLRAGVELDRRRARSLNRALRESRAFAAATRALAHRDRSTAEVSEHLAQRGVRPVERATAIEALREAGYLDDTRFAMTRAALLASRGYGDEAVRLDLERHGVGSDETASAVASLEPERARAQALVARLGATPRTAAKLARRGFTSESVEDALGAVLPRPD